MSTPPITTTTTPPQQPKGEYEFHPIANIFPLMTGDEFNRFKEDIKARKQQEPIIIYQEKILDGRNRYNACKELRLTPDIKPYDGYDPLGFVLSANLHRRHLNESQRSMIAAKLSSLKLGANQHTKEGPSIEEASKRLNVGKASVERARKVIDDGDPELVKAVEQNKVRVSAAATKLLSKTPDEQRKILADPKLLAQTIKPSERTPLDRLEKAWDREDLATQEAFVEAKYQDLKKLMKAVDQKQKEAA
jgi:ParB/Sulfiredoxin domain